MNGEQNIGTTPVRTEHRFDQGALERWLQDNVEDYRGELRVRQFKGGQSNPTYELQTPGRSYVLRRKPPGQLLKGAHAVEREYRILAALGSAGFPVAKIYGLCTDKQVIGTEFYVMEFVAGRVIWDATFAEVPSSSRRDYFDAMNATLAQLHSLDYGALGLSDFGKPGNYFARQISRWSKQYLEDDAAGRVDDLDRLIEWLPAHVPLEDTSSIVHGDFRCDNMIFHPTEPKVLAVLDWELSTLGHPLADFAYHAMMYRLPPGVISGLAGADLQALGIPTEADYVAAYCRRTGRDGIEGYDFYIAFNLFRLASIMHGIRGRVLRGTAASSHAQQMAASVEFYARLAWEQVERANASGLQVTPCR